MNQKEQLFQLLSKISDMENKISDTSYFIETALCRETKQIYQGTLLELTNELIELYKLRDILNNDYGHNPPK